MDEFQTSKLTGIALSTLRKARSEGTVGGRTPMPPYIKIGKTVKYSRDDVERWIAELPRVSR